MSHSRSRADDSLSQGHVLEARMMVDRAPVPASAFLSRRGGSIWNRRQQPGSQRRRQIVCKGQTLRDHWHDKTVPCLPG